MKIFLSYGHDINSPIVERIADDLEVRGHDVWIDRTRLRAGHDWRRKIVDGLKESEIAFSCLSSHYVESEVCLDELAIALAERSGNVHTVLLENPKQFEVPVGVSHLQWLDMHDWRDRQSADTTAYEAWYQSKLSEILRILDDPDNQRFAGEIGWLSDLLRPAPFSARMGELLSEKFFGRKWLLDDIEKWRTGDRSSRVFCITGEPGIGKSAIAAWLAHFGKAHVIAIHFCQHDHPTFGSPASVIRSIACQMAARLPDYRRFLVDTLQRELRTDDPADERSPQQRLDAHSAAELFDLLIAQAAHFGLRGGRERYLVVIDALDEAGSELARFLAQKVSSLPDWLAFVVTSRPDEASIRTHLAALSPKYLDAADDRNRSDLKGAAQQWLSEMGLPDNEIGIRLDQLLLASAGNFLYLTLLRKFSENAARPLQWPQQTELPLSLASLYATYLARACPEVDGFRTDVAPFLRLIVAARAPLRLSFIQEALEVDDEDMQFQVLRPLGSLLRRRGAHVELFHKTLCDWLTNTSLSDQYFVSRSKGQKALGAAVFTQFKRSPNGLVRLLMRARNCDRRVHLWAATAPDPNLVAANERLDEVKALAARSLFAGAMHVDATAPGGAIGQTRQSLANPKVKGLMGTSFENSEGCVAPDVLLKDDAGGWIVCRLSASTTGPKPADYQALAIQVHLLGAPGLTISGARFVFINNQFILVDPDNYDGIFSTEDISPQVLVMTKEVPRWIEEAQKALQGDEPTTGPGKHCREFDNTCAYLESHCDPAPEQEPGKSGYLLSHLQGANFGEEFVARMRKQGVFDLRDVPELELPRRAVAQRIWRATRAGESILEPEAAEVLGALPYPHHFLDFEAISEAVPRWPGTRPYAQVPFAWSCHREDVTGNVEHFEFIDVSGSDPRRGLAEALLEKLGGEGAIFTYSPFEKRVLKQLAEQFPEMAERLNALSARIVDLLPIVRNHYYHPEMRGSFSIKKVLPTLGIALSYGELDDVKDGLGAMDAYRKVQTLRARQGPSMETECQRLAASISQYCAVDTLTLCQLARRLSGKPYL